MNLFRMQGVTVRFEDIAEGYRYEYMKPCPCCTMECKILTKRDDFPEYYTGVYVQCTCGEYIEFELPVN